MTTSTGTLKFLWQYASKWLCIATWPHTQKQLRQNMWGRGDTVLIGRGETSWSPRWKGEGWVARADCASAKSLIFRLSSSRLSEYVYGLQAKYMNFPAARTCVAILKEASAGVLMPCHWGPVQNKAIRSEATRRFCPEFPPEYKTALLSLNSIFTYHLQLFQPAVLVLLLVTAVPNFRGNAPVNFAWSRFQMSWNIPNLIVHLIFNSKCEDQNHTLIQRKKKILLSE